MGNLEVWDRDYLDFTLRPTPFPLTPMGWSAAKKAANYLLLQAKTDATKNTKYLAACTNVTFHDNHRQWQKGGSQLGDTERNEENVITWYAPLARTCPFHRSVGRIIHSTLQLPLPPRGKASAHSYENEA